MKYLRFGKAPKNGISEGWDGETIECGVSVFNYDIEIEECVDIYMGDNEYTLSTLIEEERLAFWVYGEEVGTGSGEEPCIEVEKEEEIPKEELSNIKFYFRSLEKSFKFSELNSDMVFKMACGTFKHL